MEQNISKKYEANRESLSAHVIPDWYENAKLGIFIHWGIYAVPAYGALSEDGVDLLDLDQKENPYAEWYGNTMRIKGSTAERYHNEHYGKDFDYYKFAEQFEADTANFNADEWAEFFSEAGAKYVVLTTKHHDGYLLWPSDYKNARKKDCYSKKDLVGEITQKVTDKGMKMGLYYSGLLDWTYNTDVIDDYVSFLTNFRQSKEYVEYSVNHFYELIEKYKPSVLWNDIGFPIGYDLNELFAHYYNSVPDGVINDRWGQSNIPAFLKIGFIKRITDKIIRKYLSTLDPEKPGNPLKTRKFHADFTTPEYVTYKEAQPEKFESTRGIGNSFGYNRMEEPRHMLTGPQLISMLVDIVSKNGNLLINVGPMSDGTIPLMQKEPLLELGAWLKIHGEAIYGTRPWERPEGITSDGKEIRFTKKDNAFYIIVLADYAKGSICIKDMALKEGSTLTLMHTKSPVKWQNELDCLRIDMQDDNEMNTAYVIKVEGPK